jgi:hypothetical protein
MPRSECLGRGAGCLNRARPDLWEPRVSNHPRSPGPLFPYFFLSNCFTSSRERADELGDGILIAEVPLPKIFFFKRLLAGMRKGEDEFVVVGRCMW